MIITKRYVLDTNILLAYFNQVFNSMQKLSPVVHKILDSAIQNSETPNRLSIPSIVFIEIYEKWLNSDELYRKFFYEVYTPICDSPNIEIRSIDREILENIQNFDGLMRSHDLHDKIVLASAVALNCTLITTDSIIKDYVDRTKIIPEVIN